MPTEIICSGFNKQLNMFVFVSKHDIDYQLNIYNNANKTILQPTLLSSVSGYPNGNSTHPLYFADMCSYAATTSSIYFGFNFALNNSSSLDATAIYQLRLDSTDSLPTSFVKTSVEISNVELQSFVHVSGVNNTSNIAYIATSADSQLSMLSIIDLSRTQYQTTKNISESGILAVGGTGMQSLYHIQSNAIDIYRLDTMQYSRSIIEGANITLNDLRKGTAAQSFNSLGVDHVSIYHPSNGRIDILDYNVTKAKFNAISLTKDGHINLTNYNGTAATSTATTSSISKPSPRASHIQKRSSIYYRTFPKKDDSSEDDYYERSIKKKRAVLPDGESSVLSNDGVAFYHSSQVASEGNSPLPQNALLIPASGSDIHSLPYDYALFSSNDANQYTVSIESSRPRAVDPSHSTPDAASNSGVNRLDGGAIAGIVIGVIAFIAAIVGLLVYTKKRKQKAPYAKRRGITPAMSSYNSGTPFVANSSQQPNNNTFTIARYSNFGTTSYEQDNHSHTSSILQEATFIPEEYHDGTRPDIRPLSYGGDNVDYAQLTEEELLQLEPEIPGPLSLFSGQYTSAADEHVTYLQDGYSIRTFSTDDGTKHTVHYFSVNHLDTFVRSVHAVLRVSPNKGQRHSLISPDSIIKSERAIILSQPTPNSKYQYLWITSPMLPEHSLHHLLFETTQWTFIDYRNMDYKVWSIYSLLKSIETMHSHKFAHLAIDPKSFYFDHEMKATDWRLGNMSYARFLKQGLAKTRGGIIFAPSNAFTAPEVIQRKDRLQLEPVDIWSLGCVVYSVATGGLLLFQDVAQVKQLTVFQDDMKQHIKQRIRNNVDNEVFRAILDCMLQVDPSERKSIKTILEHWNSIYNMNE